MKTSNPNFSKYPLVWLAGGLMLGIIFGKVAAAPALASLAVSIGAASVAFAIRGRRYAGLFLLIAFCFAGIFILGESSANERADRIKTVYDSGQIESGEPVEVEGTLIGKPEPSIDGFIIRLQVEKLVHDTAEQNVSGVIKLFAMAADPEAETEYAAMDLRYGTRIRVACDLSREEQFQDPGVVSQKLVMDQQGIDATGTIKSPLLVEVLGRKSVFVPLAWIFDQRQDLIYSLRQNLNPSTAGVLIASLLGDRHFLDKRTADVFREGGTFHVLVISGLHITFIGGMILVFIRIFTRNRVWPVLATTAFLWLYAFAVGAEVPVVRATLMFTVLACSQLVHRNGTLFNSLGLCAILILAWRPYDLFTASFQLTFVSVGAIVVIAFPLIQRLREIGEWTPTRKSPFPPNTRPWLRQFCEALYWREDVWMIEQKRHIWTTKLFKTTKAAWLSREGMRKLIRYVFEGMVVSFVVQACLLPFLIVYFHRLTMASIFLNLWVGFFIAVESFAALTGTLLSYLDASLAGPFFRVAEFFNWMLTAVPGFILDTGWASFRLPAYSGVGRSLYFLYVIPVAILSRAIFIWDPFQLIRRGTFVHLRWCIAFLILSATIIVHPFSAPSPDGRLHIDFLDVGQGDSALITFPDGQTMLVDGGGKGRFRTDTGDGEEEQFEPDTQRIGEAVVSEFLWDKGYSKIDYILATHADADHIQGLVDVSKNFEIKYAMFGRTPADDANYTELADVLAKRRVAITTIARGDELNVGGVSVTVLYPAAGVSPNEVSNNDHSVVLRIVFGSKRILMTGDIEKGAERSLLAEPTSLEADVIKVPHHGSRTSSTEDFVNAVGAKLAVISVGRHSVFGHPNPEVVERWKMSGAAVLITGEAGTVSVSTDGQNIYVDHFRK